MRSDANSGAVAGGTKALTLEAPLTINWAINNSCNFACRHCYSRVDTHDELDRETLFASLEKVAKAGVFSINFGGGEPLLRRDLLEIARFAAGLGLRLSMNSNGWFIDRETATALREAGFTKVGISIDSHRAEVHDRFRGVPGSHQRAVAALGHLAAAGIATSVSTVICRINHTTVEELVTLALDHGAGQLNFHNFKCSGLGLAHKDELDLSPAEWREFYRQALVVKERERQLDVSLDDPIIALLGARDAGSLVKGSVCGKLSLNIKANGDMTPCGFVPVVIGNITRDDLRQVWRDAPILEKMRNKQPTGKCAGCSKYEDCLGGCSARALALTGDLNSPDPHCWA
ncbi:GeoRSP system radical SAM/SPASM protein [Geotalea uraniireducens]|uniref:GeoRSP system radical SAM/SPASM protein n=1 Tax=Geotalea uraniireducens TaxID=351604 RepID=A0ABM8EPB2_9BACT|nr:GeoRSP system radical SAM/SPASM protein [Geotalea uraniireducens]BDV44306.1 GeoRSP system radical SAM/SPASM protein [Geotalea uraniireducens]